MKTKNIKHMTLMVGDQSPADDKNVEWVDFFDRKTAFLTGVDRIAKKLDLVVVFPHLTKPRRGYYEMRFVSLQANGAGGLIERYSQALQKAITGAPEMWLWTHRRWKLSAKN